ncbi:DUF6882 domain-containing protein [Alienimonas chondri]|uniref:Lipoprotein n=1 Tax=Alienimonas chondri TaxID=2681879 RepID=A0ABX1VM74_9PLAN|nr:DUF6882 domain-containing protein [Alienimonas chondri]NNJ27631.1 hypothetical protein [Alienimonas chondri]
MPRSPLSAAFSLLLVATLGCAPDPAAPEPTEPSETAPIPSADAQPATDFEQLVAASVEELETKTELNKAWGLGTFDRWDLDQQTGEIVFSNADGTTARASAQIIGSFSANDSSWLWAWDNPSIADALKADARTVKAYGEEHGIDRLTTRKWTGTEEGAWEMAAVAAKLCGATGVYRGPAGRSSVFITFGEVDVRNSGSDEE